MSLGLVSSSFNSKTASEILDIAKRCSLNYIQWCACHVPHDDFENAEKIAHLTQNSGITTAQYNSSFNLIESSDLENEFLSVLKTAEILGTDSICLRAGCVTYESADEEYLAEFLRRLDFAAKTARQENKNISFEFLSGTLFDNYMTTISLLMELDYDNVFINWQPNSSVSLLYSLFELKTLIKFVKNVHIILSDTDGIYQPLVESQDDWRQYINILRTKSRYLFIKTSGSPDSLAADSVIMHELLKLYDK